MCHTMKHTVHNPVPGDIHQPLHSADGYFDDARLGHLPQGDRGGNLTGGFDGQKSCNTDFGQIPGIMLFVQLAMA